MAEEKINIEETRDIVIKVKGVSKTFKTPIQQSLLKMLFRPKFKLTKAVNELSFEIRKGESVAFLGPNGAWKTTTTKMLSGLIFPTSGSVEVLGYTPFDRKPEFLRRIGLVMGNKSGMNWDLTPKQSFELIRNIYEIPMETFKNRLSSLMEMLKVNDFNDIQVRRLSLGERMKLELINSILHNPEVLFLDEPTIGLDVVAKQRIREFLRSVQKEYGTTLLLTSHDMDDVEKVCDRVIIINYGEKIYDDSIDALMNKYDGSRSFKLFFDTEIEAKQILSYVEQLSDFEKISEREGFLEFVVPREQTSDFLSKISSFEVKDIDIQSVPLENIISEIFVSTK